MRFAIVLSVLLSVAACGKKKPAQTPGNAAPAAQPAEEQKQSGSPADAAKPASKKSGDPCEGGE